MSPSPLELAIAALRKAYEDVLYSFTKIGGTTAEILEKKLALTQALAAYKDSLLQAPIDPALFNKGAAAAREAESMLRITTQVLRANFRQVV